MNLFQLLITIHTVTYHSKPQSPQLLCLCLLFHITLGYSIVSFLFCFHFSHGTLLLFHIPPYHLSNLLQPLSIFLFLHHIKCIQIIHASMFLLVHIYTYHPHTSMPSLHSLSLAIILSSPSVSLLPHISICKTKIFIIKFFILA